MNLHHSVYVGCKLIRMIHLSAEIEVVIQIKLILENSDTSSSHITVQVGVFFEV